MAHSSSTETRQCSTFVKKCFQCKTRLLKELLKNFNTLQVKEVKIVVLISLQGSLCTSKYEVSCIAFAESSIQKFCEACTKVLGYFTDAPFSDT